jgi:hypothetical protein
VPGWAITPAIQATRRAVVGAGRAIRAARVMTRAEHAVDYPTGNRLRRLGALVTSLSHAGTISAERISVFLILGTLSNWRINRGHQTPMNKEDEYRRNAAESVELAQQAATTEHKGRLLKLAERWLDLAEHAHRAAKRTRTTKEHPLVRSLFSRGRPEAE